MRSAMETQDPLVGRVLGGRFELVRSIGAGTWGVVYEAEHVPLRRKVAVKILRPGAAADGRIRNRFVIEARLLSQLDHPNIVRILDFGRDEEILFLAMEYLDGVTLAASAGREPVMEPKRAAHIMMQVASALAFAHAKSIVHRDIKPANVMLIVADSTDGPAVDHVKVCDFGLAKMLDPEVNVLSQGPVSLQGVALGTPAYMSPEQARGEALDSRTDVFAFGVLFYELLSGRKPYVPEAASDVGAMHESQTPPPLEDLVRDLDPRLGAIVRGAMERDRETRTASAQALKMDLDVFLKSQAPIRRPPSWTPRLSPLPAARAPARPGPSVLEGRASLAIRLAGATPQCAADRTSAAPRAKRVPPAVWVILVALASALVGSIVLLALR
jgi:serine/threonine-protein kinase